MTFLSEFSSVQSLSRVRLFVTPWTAALQASLSITNSWSLPKLTSIESVMPSNHLILCRPLLLLPSIFPSIRGFSNESALRIRWPILTYRLRGRRGSALPLLPVVPSPGRGGLGHLIFITLPLDHHCGSQKPPAATVTLLRQPSTGTFSSQGQEATALVSSHHRGLVGMGTFEDRSLPIPGCFSMPHARECRNGV